MYRRHALGTFAGDAARQRVEPGDADVSEQHPERRSGTRGTAPNQNYARELMELHTLGVDGGYTQQDVMEVARCFTGWRTYGNTGDVRAGTFFYDSNRHDNNSKLVLGVPIAAGGGFNDGLNVLRILAAHPSTARFISTKLLRWLLRYDPSPALVADIAGEFTRTGGEHQVDRAAHPALRQRALGAAALQASVPLHRVGAARDECERDVANTLRGTYIDGHGPEAVRLGTARRLPARVRVLGRLAAAALELRLPPGEQQHQRRRGGYRRRCSPGATSATQIADRIDELLFAGEMPAADKAALITYLRPIGQRRCRPRRRSATPSAWRWRRRPSSGTDARSSVAFGRVTRGAHRYGQEHYRTTTATRATSTVSSRAASSCRGRRRRRSR